MREEENSDLVYKFKTNVLTIHAQEPVDWVLDGELAEPGQTWSFRIFHSRS